MKIIVLNFFMLLASPLLFISNSDILYMGRTQHPYITRSREVNSRWRDSDIIVERYFLKFNFYHFYRINTLIMVKW